MTGDVAAETKKLGEPIKASELCDELTGRLSAMLGDGLETFHRDDGSFWWKFGNRCARIERLFGNQVVTMIFKDGQEIARLPGLATAPGGLAEAIVIALTRDIEVEDRGT